jgi:hypothetical protein
MSIESVVLVVAVRLGPRLHINKVVRGDYSILDLKEKKTLLRRQRIPRLC